jgi:phosphate transport system substrate-binding protein
MLSSLVRFAASRRVLLLAPVLFGLEMLLTLEPSLALAAEDKPTIQNKGSDTMIELAQAWAEAYEAASVEVSGGGSGVGIAALINGTVDIANASRAMEEKEIKAAKDKNGKEPVLYVVGYDALAVYVHKDNPLEEISMEQLADIYGETGKVTKWSQLGVKVPGCKSDELVRLSRQNNSGTYEYFREAVLGKNGKYKLGTIDATGSKDLVTQVANNPCAIGYSGMGYKTPGVKFLKVKKGDGKAIGPSVEATHNKTYPISRPLYMYTLGEAKGALKAYIDWVRTDTGQEVLAKIGYVPLKDGERVKPGARRKGASGSK